MQKTTYNLLDYSEKYSINIFTIKDIKLYVPVVAISEKDSFELSKLHSKGFERSVHWNKHKRKSENKNTANEYRYFLKLNFVGINKLFVLVYSSQDASSNCFEQTKRIRC